MVGLYIGMSPLSLLLLVLVAVLLVRMGQALTVEAFIDPVGIYFPDADAVGKMTAGSLGTLTDQLSVAQCNTLGSSSADCRTAYVNAMQGAVRALSDGEKQAITGALNGYSQLTGLLWQMTKVSDTFNFGRPFVVAGVMFLSESFVESLVQNTGGDVSSNVNTLVKLQIYTQELADLDKYEGVYADLLKWKRASILRVPQAIQDQLYTDPNTITRYWLFLSGATWMWPCILIGSGGVLTQSAFACDVLGKVCTVTGPPQDLTDYAQIFGTDDYYHPGAQLACNPTALQIDVLIQRTAVAQTLTF